MLNALVMSYSRLPLAMAQDGCCRSVGKTHSKTRAPWVAIVVLATAGGSAWDWIRAAVTLDIILYGASLMLEFVTLVVLRIREAGLKRDFGCRADWRAPSSGRIPLLVLGLRWCVAEMRRLLG